MIGRSCSSKHPENTVRKLYSSPSTAQQKHWPRPKQKQLRRGAGQRPSVSVPFARAAAEKILGHHHATGRARKAARHRHSRDARAAALQKSGGKTQSFTDFLQDELHSARRVPSPVTPLSSTFWFGLARRGWDSAKRARHSRAMRAAHGITRPSCCFFQFRRPFHSRQVGHFDTVPEDTSGCFYFRCGQPPAIWHLHWTTEGTTL